MFWQVPLNAAFSKTSFPCLDHFSLLPTLIPKPGKGHNSQEWYSQIKIKTATFCEDRWHLAKRLSQKNTWMSDASRDVARFLLFSQKYNRAVIGFGCSPTFWSQGKHSKNLDRDLMDSSICQDVSLLSGFFFLPFFSFFFFLKTWDASKIVIKSSSAPQRREVIADLPEQEGGHSGFAERGRTGQGSRSQAWRGLGSSLVPAPTRPVLPLGSLPFVFEPYEPRGQLGLKCEGWRVTPGTSVVPASLSSPLSPLDYTRSKEDIISYEEGNFNRPPITF